MYILLRKIFGNFGKRNNLEMDNGMKFGKTELPTIRIKCISNEDIFSKITLIINKF